MADVVAKAVEQAPVVLASRAGGGTMLSHTYGFIGSEQDLLARGVIPAGWLDGRKARGADDGSRLGGILSSLRDNASAYVSLSVEARPQQVPDANEEHAELIRRYRSRDADAVAELTVRHLHSTLDAIEKSHARGAI
jgi:hypothetical protein